MPGRREGERAWKVPGVWHAPRERQLFLLALQGIFAESSPIRKMVPALRLACLGVSGTSGTASSNHRLAAGRAGGCAAAAASGNSSSSAVLQLQRSRAVSLPTTALGWSSAPHLPPPSCANAVRGRVRLPWCMHLRKPDTTVLPSTLRAPPLCAPAPAGGGLTAAGQPSV